MHPQEIAVIIVCCLFASVTGILIFLPSRDAETGADKTRLEYLYERKEVVYENLRDLNFEFKAGKFTQEDYDGMRLGMESEAARLLAEIEQLESVPA
jgi:hypothetical protein